VPAAAPERELGVLPTAGYVVLGVVVLGVVAGFVVLGALGRDTTGLAVLVAGPLVTTIVGGVLSQRVRRVEEVARTVETQTNGAMSAQFAGVHDHLDAQTTELTATVAGVAGQPAPARTGRQGIPAARSSSGEHPSPRPSPDQPVSL
jgi:hypothetical protein